MDGTRRPCQVAPGGRGAPALHERVSCTEHGPQNCADVEEALGALSEHAARVPLQLRAWLPAALPGVAPFSKG